MRDFERLPLSAATPPPPAAPAAPDMEPLAVDADGWDEPADAGWSAPLVRDPDEPQYDRVWTGRVDGEDRGLLRANGKHPVRPAPPRRDGRANARPAWLWHAAQVERAKRAGG